jgi:hypothetical protein
MRTVVSAADGKGDSKLRTPNSELTTGYNVRVTEEPRTRALRSETIGLIVIAVILAIMILVRWGGIIAWSAR